MARDVIDQTIARETFGYDGATGLITWKVDRGKVKLGDIAGWRLPSGYRQIEFDGTSYLAHRLAFLITFGRWPQQVDHINGVRDDNRISNLRECSTRENQQNRRKHRSGHLQGTRFMRDERRAKPWRAEVLVGRRRIHLGCFRTAKEAHTAYMAACQKLKGG